MPRPDERRRRRDLVGIACLLALLSLAAALPGVLARFGSWHAPATAFDAVPFGASMAAIAIIALMALQAHRLQSRCHRLESAREADGHAALHDPLTGAANRRQFEQRLHRCITEEAPRHALLMIDLDRFKPVNDLYGHAAGDALLRDIATGLTRLVGPGDLVARLGGDEFALLLHGSTGASAERIALAVLEFVSRYRLNWEGQRVSVGTSIGMVAIDRAGLTASDLLAAADAGLYAAKEAGRGAAFIIDTPDGSVPAEGARRIDAGRPEPVSSARSHEPQDGRRQELYASLMTCRPTERSARLSQRQGSRRRREIGRWIAVEPVTIGDEDSPGMSVRELVDDAAVQADGGADLARWVLGMTLDAAARLTPMALGRIGFALPISAHAVAAVPSLGDELLRANALATRPIRHLSFVLHHTGAVHGDPALSDFHRRLHASGVRIGIELRVGTLDVLAPLSDVPYDELHLGRELTRGFRPGTSGHAAVKALLGIADRFGACVVATGVDTPESAEHLIGSGVERLCGPVTGPADTLHRALQGLKNEL